MSSTETYSVIMSLFCCPLKVAQTICAISGSRNALQLMHNSEWLYCPSDCQAFSCVTQKVSVSPLKPGVSILPCRPITLLMTIMWPDCLLFMSGMTSFIMRTVPKKLVSNTLFISSMLMLSTGPSKPTPALLTGKSERKDGWLWSWLFPEALG